MRKVILYIATSLDGFIAREDGSVDWLYLDQDYGYQTFRNSIDTTLMGGSTYRTVLGFDEFPYKALKNYVFTLKAPEGDHPYVDFVTRDIPGFVSNLKQDPGKDIFLVGGGETNTLLQTKGLIDELVLSIHPLFLGKGVPLFANYIREQHLELISNKSFDSGLVQLHYKF